MTGFGVDIGQLSALPGKVSGIGESLTNAAGKVGGSGGGEFGHPQLNQVVSQLSGLLQEYLGGLGKSANGMADKLQSTLQSYAGADSSNAASLGGIGGDLGAAGALAGGAGDGFAGGAGGGLAGGAIGDVGGMATNTGSAGGAEGAGEAMGGLLTSGAASTPASTAPQSSDSGDSVGNFADTANNYLQNGVSGAWGASGPMGMGDNPLAE